jgi:hypothetical protein
MYAAIECISRARFDVRVALVPSLVWCIGLKHLALQATMAFIWKHTKVELMWVLLATIGGICAGYGYAHSTIYIGKVLEVLLFCDSTLAPLLLAHSTPPPLASAEDGVVHSLSNFAPDLRSWKSLVETSLYSASCELWIVAGGLWIGNYLSMLTAC